METILKRILSQKPSGKIIFQGKDSILVWGFDKKYRYTVEIYLDHIRVDRYTKDGCYSSPYYGKLQSCLRKYIALWSNVENVVKKDCQSCVPVAYFKV